MIKNLLSKIKEALLSVLPVALIVFFLNFTPLFSLTPKEMAVFLISTLLLILGIGLFNLGADLAMTPMGTHIGSGLTKSKNLFLLATVSFAMGLFITIAEPDLSVLATQVSDVLSGTLLIVTVGVGVGFFLLIAVLKIVFHQDLSKLLIYFYMLIFALAALVVMGGNESFLPLAFDSGGVTTGPITVPFIMAFGVGIASALAGKNAGENSFGLVALCSVGPILAVLALGMTITDDITYVLPDYSVEAHLGAQFFPSLMGVVKEVAIALGLVVVFFLLLQFVFLKLPRKKLAKIAIGILYTFTGLVIFLTAVSVGYMPIGYRMGEELAKNGNPTFVILFSFVLGLVVVLAEPAIHVLTKQVEEVTGGGVTKRSLLLALSLGVGVSIGLSILRIYLGFSILYYLIPGYFISLGLSFFVPRLYTSIAFDSGGVASGPLTSSFILPFAIGICYALHGVDHIMSNAFGVVAMVAMTPLITIQVLGFRSVVAKKMREHAAMKRIIETEDEQIIRFM